MTFPERFIGERMFPETLARQITAYYMEKGVEVLPGQTVVGLERRTGLYRLRIKDAQNGREVDVLVDGVVAGIGIRPNTELAEEAGLSVDDGILVDASLRTSDPNIFAAGDVAVFENPALGVRMRVEHEDNANTMGMMAGQSMAGADVRYDHLPFFYSDLFDMGYEAVGVLDPSLDIVEDWREPYRQGVVYYLRDGRVRGVLLWDVWQQVDNARALIAAPGRFTPQDLKGYLPKSEER
jgi:NADPH-dependent 2,4-dienoyl-CoA reductase/sulfur reductase-like enzyme